MSHGKVPKAKPVCLQWDSIYEYCQWFAEMVNKTTFVDVRTMEMVVNGAALKKHTEEYMNE